MNFPTYNLPTLPKHIIKASVPFSLDNHLVLNRYQRGDTVMYCGKPYTFFGVVSSKVKKPKCELFAYALQEADGYIFMVLDLDKVRLVRDV